MLLSDSSMWVTLQKVKVKNEESDLLPASACLQSIHSPSVVHFTQNTAQNSAVQSDWLALP